MRTRRPATLAVTALAVLLCVATGGAQDPHAARAGDARHENQPIAGRQGRAGAYLGFDRNDYPGDAAAAALRKTFAFCGYWLNAPPGKASDTWQGKRAILRSDGFGFLALFNGRLDKELKAAGDAKLLGARDADAAVKSARKEGFPARTVIFLDQEEGGRLLPEQREYLDAWMDGVTASEYRAGVYCSGIPAEESGGASVVTANDIRKNAGGRTITFFVYNDACPPSPGCDFSRPPLPPKRSGVSFAEDWQFAQSPRRRELTARCRRKYNSDGNCYAPLTRGSQRIFVDLDAATSRDPSSGR